jgi:hypothetical protein
MVLCNIYDYLTILNRYLNFLETWNEPTKDGFVECKYFVVLFVSPDTINNF